MSTSTAHRETLLAGRPAVRLAEIHKPLPILGLSHSIETPENVRLTYRLAGPSVRSAAYLIDLMVIVFLLTIGACFVGIAMASFAMTRLPGAATTGGLYLLVMFLLNWFYFTIGEAFFRGRTIGKRMLQLRVIMDGGYPITLWAAVLRNLIRFADGLPSLLAFQLCGVGYLTMLMSSNYRRMGDLVARTIVIQESPMSLPREPIILEKIQSLNRSEIGAYVPSQKTLALIEQFLSRRHVLTYRRGHEMAGLLANTLAKRMNFAGDRAWLERYPMAFLASTYATYQRSQQVDDAEVLDDHPKTAAGRRQ